MHELLDALRDCLRTLNTPLYGAYDIPEHIIDERARNMAQVVAGLHEERLDVLNATISALSRALAQATIDRGVAVKALAAALCDSAEVSTPSDPIPFPIVRRDHD